MSLDQSIEVEHTAGLTAGGYLGDPSLSLANEILPNLWMGGCHEGASLPHDFGFVLSAYPWERYAIGPNTDRLQVRLYDSNEPPNMRLIEALAIIVNQQRDVRKVLVHCQAGLNRSGLIVATALVRDALEPDHAIRLLRERRSKYVLCNPTFEAVVRSLA